MLAGSIGALFVGGILGFGDGKAPGAPFGTLLAVIELALIVLLVSNNSSTILHPILAYVVGKIGGEVLSFAG